MRNAMNRTIRIVTFKEGDTFIASGVELDIVAQGSTEEEALSRLRTVLCAEIDEAKAHGRDLFEIGPAPDSIHQLYQGHSPEVVSRERLVA